MATNKLDGSMLENDAVTGAKLNPALVQGDIIYADGTDTIDRLAKGAAAEVLTMNAGATAPEWAAAAGGGVAGINSSANADAIVISSDEEVTMPKQPGFYAWLNGNLNTVTGDGTVYSIAGTWSEITDQNADFSNGIFTAPVTGTYIFYCNISISGLSSAHNIVRCYLQTSNRLHRWYYNGFALVSAWPVALHNGVIIADMDASDTAQMKVDVAGGNKDVKVEGNSQSQQTNFGGWLLG